MKLIEGMPNQLVMVPDENGKLRTVQINIRHISRYSHGNKFTIGEKVILNDPHKEGDGTPLFAYVRGYFNKELFSSDDDHILLVQDYRKVEERDRTFLSQSKYRHTEDLRDHCNWMFFREIKRKKSDMAHLGNVSMDMRNMGLDTSGLDLLLFKNMAYVRATMNKPINALVTSKKVTTEFLPRHLHYDDFIDKWNGRVDISLPADKFGFSRSTRYDAVGNKYGGIIIDTNFRPGNSDYLDGVEWFKNPEWYYHGSRYHRHSYRRGDDPWQDAVNDLFNYPGHPDIELYAVLDREEVGRHGSLEMWDPVKDVVRVEKILGNVSFLSEFGYICTMSKYNLIVGEDWDLKRKYALI